MKNIIYLLLCFLISISGHSAPMWQRKIINYERNEYKAGFQNWMISQSDKGWIYVANGDGLLEFDGVNWSVYRIRNNIVRSVKAVGDRVYVGGNTEFGFFRPNSIGLLTYKSLSIQTSDWGGDIWNILESRNRLYFVGDRYIHIFNGKDEKIASIDAFVKIDCSVIIDNKLYIGSSDGIFYLNKNDQLELLPSSAQLKNQKIVSILPYMDEILVTTALAGLYTIDGNYLKKMESTADSFIASNQLFSTSVSGSKIAIGSVQSGILIFDPQDASYIETFSLNKGLKNNTILSSFFDKEDNLWLGLDKGLSYINLNSPIRPLFATTSPIGTGYCSALYDGELYLGTNQGLYKTDKMGNPYLIKGTEGQIWSMSVIDHTLFCSGDNGITVISPEVYKINLSGAWEIHPLSADKDRLIVGTYSGFYILQKKANNRWELLHQVPGFIDSARGFMEDDEDYTFWVANPTNKIQKVRFNAEMNKTMDVKIYSFADIDIGMNTIFRKVDKNMVICTKNGIYQYSRITDSFNRYTQLEAMLEGDQYYGYLSVDDFKNMWFVCGNQLKFLPYQSGKYSTIYNLGLSDVLINNYENVYLLNSTSAIVSIDNAFVKIDLTNVKQDIEPIEIYIRKIACSKTDSIISYGNTQNPIVVPYSLNSVKINFAATSYSQAANIQYSYRLKSVDEDWSIPTTNTSKEYTNLHEGKYTFEVKAIMNGNTNSAKVTTIQFTISPPWYRSLLAYSAYLIIFITLLLILYRKTIIKQKRIIYEKGEELIAQSKRHEEENKLKDQEIYELQNKNLRAELHYKTQELSGYVLNVIRKNEILEEVKSNAINISKAIDDKKELSNIRQKVMWLISHINSNIEHDSDFEIFKSNFDLVHQDFFKLLDEKFPNLSRNDKILCAYLNMNLSSKEIAPLLNISIRGVEVNRYRLRKKMNLDRDINLSEYLQDIK